MPGVAYVVCTLDRIILSCRCWNLSSSSLNAATKVEKSQREQPPPPLSVFVVVLIISSWFYVDPSSSFVYVDKKQWPQIAPEAVQIGY